ncbi:MAG TPA: agmatinase [Methanosarcinaceae archaeon]|nr:agmatinase [Methanosarcinaceae archaeon]
MFNQPKMMDAPSEYGTAEYVIFGVPFDGTSSFRAGSRFAPDAMRKASANFESYNAFFDIDLAELPIHDAGDLEPYASVDDTLRDLFYAVEPIVKDGKIPIMLGGEHSLTLACVNACAKYAGDDFGVVVLDAHFDLRDEYSGLKNNHACVSRHIIDEVTDNYVSIGIRSGPKEEWDFAKDNNIRYYTPDDVAEKGIKSVVDEVIEYLDCSKIYLSLDMDALDPSFAPALGTPEPFGLNALDVREVIRTLAPMSVGFDIVEIAPEYDGGQTAMLGTKLMREFIAAHAASVRD